MDPNKLEPFSLKGAGSTRHLGQLPLTLLDQITEDRNAEVRPLQFFRYFTQNPSKIGNPKAKNFTKRNFARGCFRAKSEMVYFLVTGIRNSLAAASVGHGCCAASLSCLEGMVYFEFLIFSSIKEGKIDEINPDFITEDRDRIS